MYCVALRCVALRCVALRCVALRCVALRCVALRCVALRCVALRCVALRCVALRCVALRCVALRCVALRCVALRCVALRCVALRCVALRCVVIRPDMTVVGISANGDVGCNETGSSLVSRTRVKSQSVEVIRRNAKFFGGDIRLVPTRALTVGIATVMEAREVGSSSIDRLRVLGEEGSCQPFSIRLTWGVFTWSYITSRHFDLTFFPRKYETS